MDHGVFPLGIPQTLQHRQLKLKPQLDPEPAALKKSLLDLTHRGHSFPS